MRKVIYRGLLVIIVALIGFVYWVLVDAENQEKTTDDIDRTEEIEKNRIMNFFDELNSTYGYVHLDDKDAFWLILIFNEALYEGEISGYIMMEENDDKQKHYYEWAGITDGNIIKLYLTMDGEQKMLEGNFYGDASYFELNFWKTNKKITFHAVTEEEYYQQIVDFDRK